MNQQINSNLEKDVLALEKESQELLSSIFDVQQLDPPAEIIDAINAEARRYILMRKFNRRLRFMMKTAALAAGIMLVISGGFHINNSHSKLDRHQVVLNHPHLIHVL